MWRVLLCVLSEKGTQIAEINHSGRQNSCVATLNDQCSFPVFFGCGTGKIYVDAKQDSQPVGQNCLDRISDQEWLDFFF